MRIVTDLFALLFGNTLMLTAAYAKRLGSGRSLEMQRSITPQRPVTAPQESRPAQAQPAAVQPSPVAGVGRQAIWLVWLLAWAWPRCSLTLV